MPSIGSEAGKNGWKWNRRRSAASIIAIERSAFDHRSDDPQILWKLELGIGVLEGRCPISMI